MTVRMFDNFTAEGEPADLALYTWLILHMIKREHDDEVREKASKEVDALERLINTPLWELMQNEKDEEKKEDGE